MYHVALPKWEILQSVTGLMSRVMAVSETILGPFCTNHSFDGLVFVLLVITCRSYMRAQPRIRGSASTGRKKRRRKSGAAAEHTTLPPSLTCSEQRDLSNETPPPRSVREF